MSIKDTNAIQIDEITTIPNVGRELGAKKINPAEFGLTTKEAITDFVDRVRERGHALNNEAGSLRYEGGIIYRDAAIYEMTEGKAGSQLRY